MLIWTKGDGYAYEDERTGRRYSLLEMKALGTDRTSDIIMIWDDETDTPVNWVYGATLYTKPAELDEVIRECFEANGAPKWRGLRYRFSPRGVERWKEEVVDDILERGICGDFELTHRDRTIPIPDTAYAYEVLTNALDEILNEEEGIA